MTIESGPTSGSTRVDEKPAAFIQPIRETARGAPDPVERFEDSGVAALRFVLWEPGAQGLGEMSPEWIETVISHLENASGGDGVEALKHIRSSQSLIAGRSSLVARC